MIQIDDTSSGIYQIKNLVSGKSYIGKTINFENRMKEHRRSLTAGYHKNVHLQRAWDLYKEDSFQCFILEKCDIDQLSDREMYWIRELDTFHNGYNMNQGGEGGLGYKHTIENIEKMKESQRQRFQDKSEREKLRDAHLFESKPIYQIDFCGNIIKMWTSAQWASKELGLSVGGIFKSLNHTHHAKTCGGYIWEYVDEYDQSIFDLDWHINNPRDTLTVYQYSLDGNLIETWRSASLAASELNIGVNNIYQCCRGLSNNCAGFAWSYVKFNNIDEFDERKYGTREYNRYPIYQYTLDGNLIKMWDSIYDASTTLNINRNCIRDCCNRDGLSAGGYFWSKDIIEDMSIFPIVKEGKYWPRPLEPIYQYTKDFKLIKRWDSIPIASEETKISSNSIRNCTSGWKKTAGGFIFSRYDFKGQTPFFVSRRNAKTEQDDGGAVYGWQTNGEGHGESCLA